MDFDKGGLDVMSNPIDALAPECLHDRVSPQPSAPLVPILLSGASDNRFWPVSRDSFPGQFARSEAGLSPFQATARRLSGPGFTPPLVLAAEAHRFIANGQLAEIGIHPSATLIEPAPCGTGPAVLAAALRAVETDPDALLLIAAGDARVEDAEAFGKALQAARAAAARGANVALGVTPRKLVPGSPYLEISPPPAHTRTARAVHAILNAPESGPIEELAAQGRLLQPTGLHIASARSILAVARRHAPDLLAKVRAALDEADQDLDFCRLFGDAWKDLPAVSIEEAVLFKAKTLKAVALPSASSTPQNWCDLWQGADRDSQGLAVTGPALGFDCKDSLLQADDARQTLVGIGLRNIVAVATRDAVLVADLSRSDDIRPIVAELKSRDIPQATAFQRDERPWGWFETLALGGRFQVKRIVVKPGGRLSLQSHVHRAEHWVVVSGTARVTLGETEQLISETESVYIPLGEVHRLENPGRVPMELIEVQTGSYLGEDDIHRLDDDYRRP